MDRKCSKMMEEMQFFSRTTEVQDKMVLELALQQMMQEHTTQRPKRFEPNKAIKKSKKTCVVCCIMGEKALADNKNNEALKAFTNALSLAPESLNITAHCYYYRSVALKKLEAYSESLQDINRALELRITQEQKVHLQNRKTLTQKLLLERNSPNLTKNNIADEEVTLSYGENTEIKGVSSAASLRYNTRFGRHYLATRNIEVGDVLMIQKPYVMVMSKEGDDSPKGKEWFCENCSKTTRAPIPCDSCTMFFYCSVECKSEAFDKFHKTECKLSNINEPFGPLSSFFLRTMLIMTKQGNKFQEAYNLMENVKNREDRRTAGFKNGILDGANDEAILSLLHHRDKENLTMVVTYAVRIAIDLKRHTDFLKGSNDVRSVAKLLIFLSYICFRNFYCIRRNNRSNVTGLTMYPVMNMLNHSCACNLLSYNDKQGNTILKACKDIKKGEQLFVCYMSYDVMFLTPEQRIDKLKEGKFFTCSCEACVRNYVFKPELKGSLSIPKELRYRLRDRENDIEALWQLLKLILQKYPHPCLEAKVVEMSLVNAYLGSDNETLCTALVHLNLF